MPSAESNDTIKISQRTIAHIVSWSQIIRATVAQIAGKQQLTCQYWGYKLFSSTSKGRCTLCLPDDVYQSKTAIFPYSVAK
ncbi:hypothetical protein EI052_00415 [Escherichia coli]|nr:hypothetical protein [Escherichia coli]MQH65695.1 hypothetical protein [Escherichia coli]